MMGQLETGNIGIGNTSTLATFNNDRFLIIDDRELYLINAPKKREPRFEGEIRRRRTRRALKRPRASLKDLGRKCFAFTKLDAGEIRRIKKSAFASVAKAGKSAKTQNAATY